MAIEPAWVGNAITAGTALLAASIAILGSILTIRINSINDSKKFEKQKQWEKEKIETEYFKKQEEQKYKIYNQFLKGAGELAIYTYHPEDADFNMNEFEHKLRPILYEDLHLIDEDVRILLKNIDNIFGKCKYLETVEDEDLQYLVSQYTRLLNAIEDKY